MSDAISESYKEQRDWENEYTKWKEQLKWMC